MVSSEVTGVGVHVMEEEEEEEVDEEREEDEWEEVLDDVVVAARVGVNVFEVEVCRRWSAGSKN